MIATSVFPGICRRYGVAVAAIAAATLLRWALEWAIGELPAYITFYPAVALVAIVVGAGPGVLTTILAGLAAVYWVLPPEGFGAMTWPDTVGLGLFLTMGTFMSLVAGSYLRARRSVVSHERTEEALRRAKDEWEQTFDTVPDLVAILDNHHRIVRVNRPMADRLGLTPEQCIGLRCHDVVHGLDHPPDVCPHARLCQDGKEHSAEVHEARLGGDFLVSTTPRFDEQGRLLGSVHVARDITVRKRAEEALRESEERFHKVFFYAATGIALTDWQGRFEQCNPAYCALLGYTEEEFRQIDFASLVHPEDRAANLAEIRRLKAGELPFFEIENRYIRRDGQTVWVNKFVSVLPDETGKPAHLMALVTDISQRKRAEEALRRYELLANHSRDIILFMNRDDGRILEANAAATKAYGYSREQLLALTIHDLRAVETRDLTADQMAMADTHGILFETVHRRKDGNTFPVEVSSQGAVIGASCTLISVVRDITERKRAEEALRQSREDLDHAQAVGQIGSWRLDVGRNVLTWSDENHRMFGVPKGTPLTYETFLGIVHPDDREYVDTQWKAGLRGEPYDIEHRIVVGSQIKWVREKAYLEWDDAGKLLGGFGISQDITERKQADEAIRRTAEELARSNRELEQFAYVASHDLQEPLRSVSGFVELLRKRYHGRLDECADEYIGFVVEGAARMKQLIDDLLAFSRVGRRGQELRPVDAAQSLAASLANLKLAVTESNAVITQDPLPTVTADPTQLAQLFQNLIANALKFRRQDMPPEVHVGARREADHWVFSVRDNGIGIAPEYHERIFTIFQRLHGRSEYAGNGVGLAVCKKIIERHGGRIWVESDAGQGSTFCFTLPRS